MANIGATTAFYKVETSLTRANDEVSKSMERLATGKQNANAGDRSSYAAMADTFRLDYVGTKAGIKGASVVMGYLEIDLKQILEFPYWSYVKALLPVVLVPLKSAPASELSVN